MNVLPLYPKLKQMVKVYFQTKIHSQLVAVFDTEELFMSCLSILVNVAEQNGMEVIETVHDTELDNLDNPLN